MSSPSTSNTFSHGGMSLSGGGGTSRSPKKNFTARFQQPRMPTDELLEFWDLKREDYELCDPIQWWLNHKSTFPKLYRLAMDILSIPGEDLFLFEFIQLTVSSLASAVAVERVFSGGRDTISLRRASLKSDTIRTLMLVKKKLHQQRVTS
jgi:hypothetical protein